MKGGIRSIYTPVYDISLYELLKTYSTIKMQKAFKTINIPKLPVLTTQAAIKEINNNLENILEWKNVFEFIPSHYLKNKNLKKTGIAGLFSACLELSKEGTIRISQNKIFDELMIKKN